MSEEMMYGIDESTSEIGGSNFIDVTPETAIKSGRFLTKLEFVEGERGSYLEVEVSERNGKKANRRYYEPKIDGTIVKNKEDLKREITKFSRVVTNIARRYLAKDYKVEDTSSFKAFCQKFISDMSAVNYAQKPVKVKVVLNNAGYPTLPGYPPIMEDISVPDDSSMLSITRFDKVTPPPMPNADVDGGPSFEELASTAGTAAEKDDDLPF